MKAQDEAHGDDFTLYNGDCVDLVREIPDKTIDLSIFSPPFSSLYTYSASNRDMGNCATDEEFLEHYSFLIGELYRATRPGRLCAVHCKDLVDYAGSSGRAGLRDFPGALIRAHEAAGWKYHSRTTVWKSPVVEMQRTKAHGLLYKQLRTDSTFSRMGLPDYILWFRRWAVDGEEVVPVTHTAESFPLDQWQEWASPVWMTVDQTNVLNVEQAREDKDSKHTCPLQLDIIERVIRLHSNPGELVFSPFAGIGSEGFGALRAGRRFVGIELKPEYFRFAVRNLEAARKQLAFSLFDSPPTAPNQPPTSEPTPAPDGVSAGAGSALGTHGGEGAVGDLLAAAETTGQDTPDETGTTLAVGWAARETDGASGGHGTTGPGATTPDDEGTPAAANSSSKATKPKPRIKILLVDETGAEREATS